MTYETFKGKTWKQGDSLVITIPSNIVKYSGFNEGDIVKIIIKKDQKNE